MEMMARGSESIFEDDKLDHEALRDLENAEEDAGKP